MNLSNLLAPKTSWSCFYWMTVAMLVMCMSPAWAQQKNRKAKEEQPESKIEGIELLAPRKLDMQFGMRFQANDNICSQLVATIAFPTNWPEQQVTILQSRIPPNAVWQFRDLPLNAPPTARQLVMQIPVLQAGGELEFLFDVQIEKSFINPPPDTSLFIIPKKPGRELNWAMGNSPMIDASTSDIRRLAKSIAASEPPDAWTHVERIYDWVRERGLRRNDRYLHRHLPCERYPRALRLDSRSLLPRVLSRRQKRQGTLVPLSSRRGSTVRTNARLPTDPPKR
jgi:hypothetical protein